jgi:hypothetical protein
MTGYTQNGLHYRIDATNIAGIVFEIIAGLSGRGFNTMNSVKDIHALTIKDRPDLTLEQVWQAIVTAASCEEIALIEYQSNGRRNGLVLWTEPAGGERQ